MAEDENKTRDEDMDRLKKHCDELGEHYDSVQIFITAHRGEESQTMAAHRGVGNWYARFGQIKEWVCLEDERSRVHQRGDDDE